MSNREIKCYLCPATATIDNYDRIHCENCTWYTVTTGSKMYYFDKTGDDHILDDEDLAKLSAYVKKNYSDEEGKPVQITTDVIKAVTGKVSMKIRYK